MRVLFTWNASDNNSMVFLNYINNFSASPRSYSIVYTTYTCRLYDRNKNIINNNYYML